MNAIKILGIKLWRVFSTVFAKRAPKAGLLILLSVLGFVVAGSFFGRYSPYAPSSAVNIGPNMNHIFGTDFLGRDIYSEIAWGAYPSLGIGLTAALGSVAIGVTAGVLAGYFPRLHGLIGGATDLVMIFPLLPFLILVSSLLPASNILIALLLILVLWPLTARSIRAQVLSVKEMPYVDAAKTSGLNNRQIVFGIIVPSVLSIGIAYFIINVASGIVISSALEFLGVGNPNIVSWGSILYWAQNNGFLAGAWWWIVAPGAFISLTAIGFALIGFSIEEVFNPRLRN